MKYIHTCNLLMTVALFSVCAGLSAGPSYSGEAGVKAAVSSNPTSDYYDPQLTLQSFFASQIDFTSNTTVRAEFSIQTADIVESGIFNDTEAQFKIDELSVTRQFLLDHFLNYFSFFAGTYEPIGSDIFLRRYFGIEPIDSMLTQSWLGLKGSSIHPFYGIGSSFVTRFDSKPIAAGLYVYVNHENTDKYELNTDLRFACSYDNFCLDLAAGTGAPLNSENSAGEKAFLVIDELYLHAGLETMIGNRYSGGLFAEGGFENMLITRNNNFSFSADDVYLLLEPRIVCGNVKINLSLFSFPEKTVENLFFIDDTLGLDLAVYSDTIAWKNRSLQAGFHTTLSFPGKNISDWEAVLNNEYDKGNNPALKISPFVTLPFAGGSLQTMLQIIATNFSDSPENAVVVDLGYRRTL